MKKLVGLILVVLALVGVLQMNGLYTYEEFFTLVGNIISDLIEYFNN